MKAVHIFLLLDAIIFLILLFFIVRNGLRGVKLVQAIDHFKASGVDAEADEIIDTIEFSQDYSKNLKLHKALQKNEDFYIMEVAKVLAAELVKNKAVHIEFIQGVERDTIKGKIKYVVKI